MSLVTDIPSGFELQPKLARAYAEAVLAYIGSDTPQSIGYDPATQEFWIEPVADGMDPTDVDLWVGAKWADHVGGLTVPTDSAKPLYSPDVLRKAIQDRLSQLAGFQHMAVALAARGVRDTQLSQSA